MINYYNAITSLCRRNFVLHVAALTATVYSQVWLYSFIQLMKQEQHTITNLHKVLLKYEDV